MIGAARRSIYFNNIVFIILGSLLALGGATLFYFVLMPYFSAWVSGGTTWTAKDFANNPNPTEDIHFLTVTADYAIFTGHVEETRLNGIIPLGEDYFGAIEISDDIILMAKTGDMFPNVNANTDFTGTLEDFDSIGREILGNFRLDLPVELRNNIYPKILNVTQAENKGFWILGLAASIAMVVGGLYFFGRGVVYSFNPNGHPIWKELGRYNQPHKDLLQAVDAERRNGGTRIGKFEVTRRWIIQRSGIQFKLMRIGDIVWLHGFIQSGRYGQTYFVKVYDRYGLVFQSQVKKKELEPALIAIAERAPWALVGANPDAERIWKKDRAEFVRQIDERKKTFINAQAEKPESPLLSPSDSPISRL